MKIGILSTPFQTNYGGIIQNYALQQALIHMGHEVETIHYEWPADWKIRIVSMIRRGFLKILHPSGKPIRVWATKREEAVIEQHLRPFAEKNIHLSRLITLQEMGDLSKKYETIVVGSDQVWRYDHMKALLPYFFLKGVPREMRKVAYAASFGVDYAEIPSAMSQSLQGLVDEFRAISVRESSGKTLCRDYWNKNVVLVLDPTLLLKKEDYKKLIPPETQDNQGILTTYILDPSEEKSKVVAHVAQRNNLIAHERRVKERFNVVGKKGLEQCIVPPLEEWLRGFDEACFVVTDSFHGTVFSILFEKPFVVIANKQRGTGRLISLLQMLGLEERLVERVEDITPSLLGGIDYEKVNAILEEKRNSSLEFLENNL